MYKAITSHFLLVIAAFISANSLRAYADINDCSNLITEALNSVISISISENNNASGVIVGHNQVLTVAHALPLNSPITAQLSFDHPAKIIAVHEGYDLALLSTDTEGRLPVRLTSAKMAKQQPVWAVGFNHKKQKVVSKGQFLKTSYSGLLSTAHVEPGQSGGALFQCQADEVSLSGILQSFVARYENGSLVNKGRSSSVPATAIQQFLETSQTKALAKR